MKAPLTISPCLLLTLADLSWKGDWIIRRAFRDERPAVHPLSFLAAIRVSGLPFLMPFYLWEMAQGHHVIGTSGSIAGIFYAGIFPAFLGYILWNRAVADVGAAHAIGIGLIFAGIWLNTRRLA